MSNVVKLPSEQDISQAIESSRNLARFADQSRVNMTITGEDGKKVDVVLSGYVMDLLLQIHTDIAQGKAVNLIPIDSVLTTQEVANFLNVSRPHVVKLLESGEIPFEKVGTHRRVKLEDAIAFSNKNTANREKALDDLAALSQEMGLY